MLNIVHPNSYESVEVEKILMLYSPVGENSQISLTLSDVIDSRVLNINILGWHLRRLYSCGHFCGYRPMYDPDNPFEHKCCNCNNSVWKCLACETRVNQGEDRQ